MSVSQRRRWIAAALGIASLVVAAATVPRDAGTASPGTDAARALEIPPAPRSLAAIAPHRNPFAERPPAVASAAPIASTNPVAIPTPPASIGANASPQRVTAIATGPHPAAIVEANGHTRLVVLGDLIGERTIVAIDAAGVRFDDGSRLVLASAPGAPR